MNVNPGLLKGGILGAFFLLLVSCSSAGGEKFQAVQQVPEGKALLYLYRLDGIEGHQYPAVFINQQKLGVLKSDGFLVAELEPGTHDLLLTRKDAEAKWNRYDIERKIRFKAGEIKYYRLKLEYDKNTGLLEGVKIYQWLTPMDEWDAQQQLQRTRLSQ